VRPSDPLRLTIARGPLVLPQGHEVRYPNGPTTPSIHTGNVLYVGRSTFHTASPTTTGRQDSHRGGGEATSVYMDSGSELLWCTGIEVPSLEAPPLWTEGVDVAGESLGSSRGVRLEPRTVLCV
jgi:hypothetical protein